MFNTSGFEDSHRDPYYQCTCVLREQLRMSGRQGHGQATSGHSRRHVDPSFNNGKGGDHRLTDSRCTVTRPPSSHGSYVSSRQKIWQTAWGNTPEKDKMPVTHQKKRTHTKSVPFSQIVVEIRLENEYTEEVLDESYCYSRSEGGCPNILLFIESRKRDIIGQVFFLVKETRSVRVSTVSPNLVSVYFRSPRNIARHSSVPQIPVPYPIP